MEYPLLFQNGFDDFFIIIGCTASSSTFFSVGSTAGGTLITGAAESVGFFQKSKSIQTISISLLIGAWLVLGLMVCCVSTFLLRLSLIKFSSLATIRSKASSSYPTAIRSFLSIFSISLSRAINSLLKLYCPSTFSKRYSSPPCFTLEGKSYPRLSSGKSLHNQKMQFILVLEDSRGRPSISSAISNPHANTIDRSSNSLLVSTDSGLEYLKSCNYTKSSFVRSRLTKAYRWAILTARKLEVRNREEGRIQRGTTLFSLRCTIIWMRVRPILKISYF